jgi:hypothetical protein
MTRCIAAMAAFGVLACNPPINEPGSFNLAVTIPASYPAEHAGQTYAMALVEGVSGLERDTQVGLILASGEAVVTFADLVEEGVDYEIHLWIDSNLAGGTVDTCDGPPAYFDHQWLYQAGQYTEDGAFTLPDHNTTFTDVCGSAGSG